MNHSVVSVAVSFDERIRRLNELDLEPIKFKLVHDEDGKGWTIEKADQVEVEYKKFLALILKNRDSHRVDSVVPSKDVDGFWHAHILDTAKYVGDCENCLGFFLHHFPYLGLRGPEDAEDLKNLFQASQDYYRTEFGEPIDAESSSICTSCGTSSCAPEPSCAGDPPATRMKVRPVLTRT